VPCRWPFPRRYRTQPLACYVLYVDHTEYNLTRPKKTQLRDALSLNRRLFKAYYLKEAIERLWTYTYEGAAMRFLGDWPTSQH